MSSKKLLTFVFALFFSVTFASAKSSDFAGQWSTYWGTNKNYNAKMHLYQNGNIVTGTYAHKNGIIAGVVVDNVLRGSWYQSGNNNWGWFEFTLSKKGDFFSGRWSEKDGIWKKDSWNSEIRVAKFGGDWMTYWGKNESKSSLMKMAQRGSSVTGSYPYKNGRITGTVKGNVLTGTWRQSNSYGSFVFERRGNGYFAGKWNDKGGAWKQYGWNGYRKFAK